MSLHETPDLTIDDILEVNLDSLRLRLSARIDEPQLSYLRGLEEGLLRPNLKSRLARLGYNLYLDSGTNPIFDGRDLFCDVVLIHHMEHYRQGFDPLELVIQHYKEGKRSGRIFKVAKVVGYYPKEVLTSEEIAKGIEESRIKPFVARRIEGNVLYLALLGEVFEPNGYYGADAVGSVLMKENGRSQIDTFTRKRQVDAIFAEYGLGPITGTSIEPGGFEAVILDPKVPNVKHSEARFLSHDHNGYAHLEFYGNNGHVNIAEIGINLIRPVFR